MDEFKNSNELQHHGIKGQKWGVRRFQNKDGSLTPRGEKRAAALAAKQTREALKDKQVSRRLTIEKAKQQMKQDSKDREVERKNAIRESKAKAAAERAKAKQEDDAETYDLPDDSQESIKRQERGKKLLIGAVAVVGTVAAIYAIKKLRGKEATGDKDPEETVKDAVDRITGNEKVDKAAAKTRKAAAKRVAKAHEEAAKTAAKTAAEAEKREKLYTKLFDKQRKEQSREQQKAFKASAKAQAAAVKTRAAAEKAAAKTQAAAAKRAAKAEARRYQEIADRVTKRPTSKEYSSIFSEQALRDRYGTVRDTIAQDATKTRIIMDRLSRERGITSVSSPAASTAASSGRSIINDLFRRYAGGS